MSDSDTYDTPKPTVHLNYDSPRSCSRTPPQHQNSRLDDAYDVPRPLTILSQHNMTPSSSNSSLLLTPDSLSLSSSNRSSLANMPDYDIPRRFPHAMRSATPLATALSHTPQSTYDIPQAVQARSQPKKELPLELSSALETLAKLQNEATGAITK